MAASVEDNRIVLQYPVFSTHHHNNLLFVKITFSILQYGTPWEDIGWMLVHQCNKAGTTIIQRTV